MHPVKSRTIWAGPRVYPDELANASSRARYSTTICTTDHSGSHRLLSTIYEKEESFGLREIEEKKPPDRQKKIPR